MRFNCGSEGDIRICDFGNLKKAFAKQCERDDYEHAEIFNGTILATLPSVSRAVLSGDGEALSLNLTSQETPANKPSDFGLQRWFAAYTHSCQEKRVAQHLSARSIEFFLPVFRKVTRWKNGQRVPIDMPLFPGYVFVKVQRNERVRVLELPGVHSIVGAGREPIALPSQEIEALRRGIHLLNAEPHAYLSVGDRAKIQNGPLKGMTGIVVRKQNGCRLVLSLELIMRSVSVEVDEHDLEPQVPSSFTSLSGATASEGAPQGIHASVSDSYQCEPL